MLSFILSKMNMMVFATGIFIVAYIFLMFISGAGEANAALELLQSKAKVIEDQLNTDSLCSLKLQSIPDTLQRGIGADYLFYEMKFTSTWLGEKKSSLVLSISERNQDSVIASKSVTMLANIILIDSEYLEEGLPVDDYFYDTSKAGVQNSIALYPRGTLAPNSYVALKEVYEGETNLYIIPCSSRSTESCDQAIIKTGCYLFKEREKGIGETVPSCFNVSLELEESGGTPEHKITKETCQSVLGDTYFGPI